LLPQSASGDLPAGAVAVALAGLDAALEFQLAWRSDNANPALAAFVAQSIGVFAPLQRV
jgi:hypothetical protein